MANRINVKEIVEKYLKENGYHGLCFDDCQCKLDDLMPCSGNWQGFDKCRVGKLKDCNLCASRDCDDDDYCIIEDE
jgi:hypothetical protein